MQIGVSYFGNRYLNHYRRDLEEMLAHHVTYVVHCFREADELYYKDTVKSMVAMDHEAGLEVWVDPWAVGGVFGGEALSRFVGWHPEAQQATVSGKCVPAACLNHPSFRTFMKEWIDAAAYIGGDVVFWDEPRVYFETAQLMSDDWSNIDWACCCGVCQTQFAEKYGYDMQTELTDEVQAFRIDTIVGFLSEMSAYAKEKGLRNALCALGIDTPIAGLPDFEPAAQIKTIDIFGTDPYWHSFTSKMPEGMPKPSLEEFVGGWTRRVVEACRKSGKQEHIWVQAFSIPAGREEEVIQAVDVAVANGATNIAAWGFGACRAMSARACGDPDRMWELLGEAFGRLREQ